MSPGCFYWRLVSICVFSLFQHSERVQPVYYGIQGAEQRAAIIELKNQRNKNWKDGKTERERVRVKKGGNDSEREIKKKRGRSADREDGNF